MRPRYGRISALMGSVGVVMVAMLGGAGIVPAAQPAAAEQPVAATTAWDASLSAPDVDLSDDITDAGEVVLEELKALPEASGSGKRVVFSESRQRVWLVRPDGKVRRTYEVSGSASDNLDPGTYEVFSRSRDAFGINESGTMNDFVRFTRGPSGAAIGFHDIPVKDGKPLQTADELGTPLSSGCIRQRSRDAKALWNFAPKGTTVVVTA